MADCILTGWTGVEFAKIAAHTLPLIHAYAIKHGAACGCANLAGERPPSWMKVQAIRQALETHDRVAWIDADVVIVDDSENICARLGNNWQALVEHQTECGLVPNCGVWVLSRQMLPVLDDVWREERFLHHWWWEQAAVLEQMGYRVTDQPTSTLDKPTTLYRLTTFLSSEWNDHPADKRRVRRPRFCHVTQYADRLSTVIKLCAGARSPAATAAAVC